MTMPRTEPVTRVDSIHSPQHPRTIKTSVISSAHIPLETQPEPIQIGPISFGSALAIVRYHSDKSGAKTFPFDDFSA
jgi:hypothetical protein